MPAPDGYPIKLVRDDTPALINASKEPGELFYSPLLPRENKFDWLKRKLGEEVTEYLLGGRYFELLDILAVIDGLLTQLGTNTASALEEVSRHPRGGFHKGMMMYGRHPEFDLCDHSAADTASAART